MKRIIDLVFRDLIVGDFNELLESWALMFAIVPFGALIFCGMYVGQFMLDSTVLGVILMFVFPLLGFALLYGIRQAVATGKRGALPTASETPVTQETASTAPWVVVRLEGSSETGNRPMYTLRRMNALENMYVQKGYAASVVELQAQAGDEYTEVNWTHIVPEPPRSLATAMQRSEGNSTEPMQTSPR